MCRPLLYPIFFVLVLNFALTSGAWAELVGYWSFDEGSGDRVFDSSGNGNDGTIIGASWGEGRYGPALHFNAQDNYVEVPTSGSLETETSVTVAAWINWTDAGDDWLCILANGQQGGPWENYGLFVNRGGGFLYFTLSLDGGHITQRTPDNTVQPGEWLHACATWDGYAARIYVNGELVLEQAQSGTLVPPGLPLRIGHRDGSGHYYSGIIDEVRVYNHALTEAEILAAMEGGLGYPYALGPNPQDGAFYEDTWVNLSWLPGDFAVTHDIYIGDDFGAVYEGDEGTFVGNQADTFIVAGFPGFPFPEGLIPGTTYYWRIDEVNDVEPDSPWKGDVWSFTVPPRTAYNPFPADGAVIDPTDAPYSLLSWMSGFGAMMHTLFFGDNFDIVNSATAGALLVESIYDPGQLEPEKTYYWRVDEFTPPTTVKSDVWSFTTATATVVDNLELYNGVNLISDTWNEGTVEPSIEQTIVRSGAQSMALPYNNNLDELYSDVGRIFELPDDGKPVSSYEVVSLYLHGKPTNDAAPVFLRLQDKQGNKGVVYNTQLKAVKTGGWTQFLSPISAFIEMGVDVDNLDKVYVGVGIDPEGPIHNLNEEPLQHNPQSIGLLQSNPTCTYCSYNGVVYIDDIKLKEMGDQYAQLSKISYFNRSLLTGCVFDGAGNAVGGALVTLTPTSGAGKMYATTCGGAGRYLTAPVTAGYDVNVSTIPNKTFSITLVPGLNECSFHP